MMEKYRTKRKLLGSKVWKGKENGSSKKISYPSEWRIQYWTHNEDLNCSLCQEAAPVTLEHTTLWFDGIRCIA